MTECKPTGGDPFDLGRFVEAQGEQADLKVRLYERALADIRAGHKRSHWMWYVFPQLAGLGRSAMSRRYAIRSLDEARAYLAHPVLGPRLLECARALLALEGQSASEIFGYPDDLKLRSSATLFAHVSPAGSVFRQLLEKYFDGEPDPHTMRLIGTA